MICSFGLSLKPLNLGEKIYKYSNYDSIKKILLENGFTRDEIKKIVVSNFLTKDFIIEDKSYLIKISSINSDVTIKLLKFLFYYKISNKIIFINNTKFKIVNIYHNNYISKQFDIEKICSEELKKEIKLKIINPLFFKIGNEYIASIEPEYIFKNLLVKMKKSSLIENIELKNEFNFNNIKIKEKNIKSKYIKDLKTEGIIGEITYVIENEDIELIKFFNLALYFSFFSGIGYLTEKGYGQNISSLLK